MDIPEIKAIINVVFKYMHAIWKNCNINVFVGTEELRGLEHEIKTKLKSSNHQAQTSKHSSKLQS